MIKIECSGRTFEIPKNPSESFSLLQTTGTSGDKYAIASIFTFPKKLGIGNFCYKKGILKLEDFYTPSNFSLKEINIPKEGLDVIASLSDFKDTYEKYKVTKIIEGKVGLLDYVQIKLFCLFHKLMNN